MLGPAWPCCEVEGDWTFDPGLTAKVAAEDELPALLTLGLAAAVVAGAAGLAGAVGGGGTMRGKYRCTKVDPIPNPAWSCAWYSISTSTLRMFCGDPRTVTRAGGLSPMGAVVSSMKTELPLTRN